jgi:Subtilase family/FlgD Ig-like domain
LHRKPTFIVLLCLVVTMAATVAHANAPFPNQAGTGAAADRAPAYMPDRVLVQLKHASASRTRLQPGTTAARNGLLGIASLDAIGAQVGAISATPAIETPRNSSKASELGLDKWVLIKLAPGSDVEAAVAAYSADPNVERASPDYTFMPLVTPTDPMYPTHWGHNNTGQLRTFSYNTGAHTGAPVGTVGFDANAEAGWNGPNGFGDPSVIIAILDSGVNLSHPDLNLVDGYDFGDGDSNPEDDSSMPGHGTGCAGLAASKANNGIGPCGPAAGCSIMPIKVFNHEGGFSLTFVANGIIWATDHGADIASMSFGLFTHGISMLMSDAAFEYANAAGVVLFAGTGNFNNDLMLYPASNPRVIGVGAASPCGGRKRSSSSPAFLAPGCSPDPNGATCDNERWWGSSFGPDTKDAPNAVDILGPTMLPTTDIQGSGGYAPGDYVPYFNGVSCSSPYVAGVAALIKSKHPDWTPAQIRTQLLTTAQDIVNIESVAGWDRYSGYGMVDINAAVGCSAEPVIVGNGSVSVSSGENCCAMIHPGDLITSVSDPDGDEDIASVRITRVDDTDMNVDSTAVCGTSFHTVRVTVKDYCGNTANAIVDVNVIDATPPSITVVMDRSALWPPNHKMVSCCASITATDNCDADPDVALVSLVSNEPDNAKGHGDPLGDIAGADIGTDDRCVDLRSERMGGENGRCYTIVYSATDASSNVAYDTVEVHVPHDQSAAAIGSSGFTADGKNLNAAATTFALFVPGSATLDVRRIDTTKLYVGNTAGVIKANSTHVVDINNDQKADLAVFFDASHVQNMVARDDADAATVKNLDEELDAKAIKDGPVGMHFTLDDGTDYLVRNIYALGSPVAMPSVAGKKTFTPEQKEITANTGPSAAAPTEVRITALTSIQPNPFNPQTTVHFSLAKSVRVRISIYDVTGALVRQLVDETMPSGQHEARWDGKSDRGTGVTSGVYFVRMMAGSYREVRKIIMLK